MAKEEDLKRVDLKVNVNCCEGCRRKVVKALSLKGVLRTEIHPTLAKVTVIGNVDNRLLIKKLAKIGKIAEMMPEEMQKEEKKPDNSSSHDKKNNKLLPDEKNKLKDGQNMGKAKELGAKCSQEACIKNDKISKDPAKSREGKEEDDMGQDESCRTSVDAKSCVSEGAVAANPNIVKAVPPVNCAMIGNGNACSADAMMYYHRPMHVPYYATKPTLPYDAYYPMPCNACYPMSPACPSHHRPPLLRPQPSRFDDLFNDDNTVGCHVM